MLYPDLRRLSLVCPTGMPLPRGTHNHEAGGSNDPPPPPPSQAGPAQEEALGQRDVVAAILRNLGGGNYRDACRVAARWCGLNSEHQAACEAHQPWTDLTQAVFPGTRAPDPRNHEPEHPRDWFFYLCNRHARVQRLLILVSRRRATEHYHKLRAMSNDEWAAPYRERIADVEERIRESNKPGIFITPNQIGGLKRLLQDLKTKARGREDAIKKLVQNGAIADSTEDDPAKWMGEIAQLEAWLRGLYEDPDADPYGPIRPWLQPWWEPSWGVWGKPYWGPNGPSQ